MGQMCSFLKGALKPSTLNSKFSLNFNSHTHPLGFSAEILEYVFIYRCLFGINTDPKIPSTSEMYNQ
jgi:hypothetical protein